MQILSTIRTFRTQRFTVTVEALEDPRPDLSWDDDGEIERKLDAGALVSFCARAKVRLDERIIAENYLWSCIRKDYADFEDHRGQRGSYFASMVRLAITEARQTLREFQQVRVRESHRRRIHQHLAREL
jgi:hypothetical protein